MSGCASANEHNTCGQIEWRLAAGSTTRCLLHRQQRPPPPRLLVADESVCVCVCVSVCVCERTSDASPRAGKTLVRTAGLHRKPSQANVAAATQEKTPSKLDCVPKVPTERRGSVEDIELLEVKSRERMEVCLVEICSDARPSVCD